MLKLNWRPRAQLDRESIALYLGCERQNPSAAFSVMKAIDEALCRIRQLPDSGGRFRMDELHRKEYRTVLAGKYTIYYLYDEEAVTVYRILHQRQRIDDYALIDFPLS